jgi:hypothetical protein
MKKIILLICIGLLSGIPSANLFAQQDQNAGIIKSYLVGLEYEVKAGFNIGGTSPLPLPAEIRKIKSYNPSMSIGIEGNVTKWFGPERKWGARIALRLENKGMTTDARVKNYGMEIIGDGGEHVKGNWTGDVKTKVKNSYITVPVLAVYRFNNRLRGNIGVFASYMTEGDFSGHVYEGYLREGDPTGNKVNFSDGKTAPYDFSKDLRRFAWGPEAGIEWRAFKHLNVCGDLTWGVNDIFKKDFDTITFSMYPIYLNVGFAYLF